MIPFYAIRFPENGSQTWGANFQRVIRRTNEEVLWSAWRRDDGIQQLTKAGILTGIGGISRGKRIEVQPYILGGLQKDHGENVDDTFRYGPRCQISADL